MKDEDGIIPDSEYDPTNPVHNPAAYMQALQDVDKDINERVEQIRRNRANEYSKVYPGEKKLTKREAVIAAIIFLIVGGAMVVWFLDTILG